MVRQVIQLQRKRRIRIHASAYPARRRLSPWNGAARIGHVRTQTVTSFTRRPSSAAELGLHRARGADRARPVVHLHTGVVINHYSRRGDEDGRVVGSADVLTVSPDADQTDQTDHDTTPIEEGAGVPVVDWVCDVAVELDTCAVYTDSARDSFEDFIAFVPNCCCSCLPFEFVFHRDIASLTLALLDSDSDQAL